MAQYILQCKHDAIHLNSEVTYISLSNDGYLVGVVTNDTDRHHFSHVISAWRRQLHFVAEDECVKARHNRCVSGFTQQL